MIVKHVYTTNVHSFSFALLKIIYFRLVNNNEKTILLKVTQLNTSSAKIMSNITLTLFGLLLGFTVKRILH